MKITLDIPDDLAKALDRSNQQANPDPETRPALEDFAATVAIAKFSEHATIWRGRDADAVIEKVRSAAAKMSAEDMASIAAVADAAAAKEVSE